MLTNTENKRVDVVYSPTFDNSKECMLTVDINAVDHRRDNGVFRSATARYAAALAMSAADKEMLLRNMTELGYENITLLSFDDSSVTKIGMAIGIREQQSETVVAIVLRPTIGREWYSNFDIGYGTEHAGFRKAAEYAEQRVYDWLYVHQPRRSPRFFVTGYSRGGAVANLLSKRLCDRCGVDMVRGYTFASPNTGITVKGARYSSIFNLVRDEDFFTRVPLTGWGYTRYGHTLSLSDSGDISGRYRFLTGEEYIGFTKSEDVDGFLYAVMRLAPNVHAYYERRYTAGGMYLSLYEYMQAVAEILADEADETTGDIMMSAMVSDFAQLSDFLTSGMDISAFLSPAQGIPRCSVADSHSPAAYMASLEEYLK